MGFKCNATKESDGVLLELTRESSWYCSKRVGGYTIDLNEVVGLCLRLSVLSLRLPWQIEEVKGCICYLS